MPNKLKQEILSYIDDVLFVRSISEKDIEENAGIVNHLRKMLDQYFLTGLKECLPEEKPSLQYSWNECLREIQQNAEAWVKND